MSPWPAQRSNYRALFDVQVSSLFFDSLIALTPLRFSARNHYYNDLASAFPKQRCTG